MAWLAVGQVAGPIMVWSMNGDKSLGLSFYYVCYVFWIAYDRGDGICGEDVQGVWRMCFYLRSDPFLVDTYHCHSENE